MNYQEMRQMVMCRRKLRKFTENSKIYAVFSEIPDVDFERPYELTSIDLKAFQEPGVYHETLNLNPVEESRRHSQGLV